MQKNHTSELVTCHLCGESVQRHRLKVHWQHCHCNGHAASYDFVKDYYHRFIDPSGHYCAVCGKPLTFSLRTVDQMPWGGYPETCSKHCRSVMNNRKFKIKWNNEHPGEPRPFGFENCHIQEKIKECIKERYGVDNISQLQETKDKVRQTMYNRYGSFYFASKEYKECAKKKNIERYGVEWYTQTDEFLEKCKKTYQERYGVDNISQLQETKDKVFNTKKANGTFWTSKLEDSFYNALCSIYGKKNVVREYKDERYANPSNGYRFSCDLYIISEDLFIEIQGYEGHGLAPYKDDEMSAKMIEKLKRASNEDEVKKNIRCFTEIDPLKRKVAKENSLNYREVFCKNEMKFIVKNVKAFIDSGKPIWSYDNNFEDY